MLVMYISCDSKIVFVESLAAIPLDLYSIEHYLVKTVASYFKLLYIHHNNFGKESSIMDPLTTIDPNLWQTIIDIIYSIPSQGGKWLITELSNNQFLVATAIPTAMLGVWYAVRNVFHTIVRYITMTLTSEVAFNSDNEYYHEITQYLYDKSLSKMFQRFYTISYSWQTEGLIMTIGYGISLGFIGMWPVIINRMVEESQSSKFKEKVTITIIGGRKSAIKQLMDNLNRLVLVHKNEDSIFIYMADKDGGMDKVATKPHRSLDTVILPQSDKDYVVEKLTKFMESEDYYVSKGLPYHIGIILSGPPGTGKTSLIHALASHFGRNICFCPGGQIRVTDMDLKKMFLVIEDIDSNGMMVKTRTDGSDDSELVKSMSGESMSSILNILDGLVSPHGLITFATTNRYDSLDPAIVRPGRFDIHLEFKNMEWPEWLALCKLLDRDSPVSITEYVVISPAQARYMLLYYSDDDIIKFFKSPIQVIDTTPSITASIEHGAVIAEPYTSGSEIIKRRIKRGRV